MRAQLWAGAQNRCHVVGPFLHSLGPTLCRQLLGVIPCVGDTLCPAVLMVGLQACCGAGARGRTLPWLKVLFHKSEPAASSFPALVLVLTSTWCPSGSEGEHCQSIPPSFHLPSTHLSASIPPPPCSSLNNSSSAWRCADCSPVLPLVITQPSKTDIVLCGSSRISHSSPRIIFLLGHGVLHDEHEVPPPFITPILADRAPGPTSGE